MGIDYCLVNKCNQTLFEVPRGCWYELCDYELGGDAELLYEEYIYDLLLVNVFPRYDGEPKRTEEDLKYYQWLARQIYKFINGADPKDIVLANDCNGSILSFEEAGYDYVGHGFHWKEPKEYESYLQELCRESAETRHRFEKRQKAYIDGLLKQGYKVMLGPNDEILAATYWHPELLISKIIPKGK